MPFDGKQVKDLTVALSKLAQSSALLDQVPVWNGVSWVPTDQGGASPTVLTVPTEVSVGDLVYMTGSLSADRADNSDISTALVAAVVTSKPTSTTATVIFSGVISGYEGLTPGARVFLGSTGGIIESGSLPTSPGSVIKRVGIAISATAIVFAPNQAIIL